MREAEFRLLVVSLLETIANAAQRTAEACERAEQWAPTSELAEQRAEESEPPPPKAELAEPDESPPCPALPYAPNVEIPAAKRAAARRVRGRK